MHRLATLLALSTLAACTSPGKPTAASRGSTATTPTGQYDFSDLANEEIPLAQFIRDCQARTAFSFTYGPEAGAVIDKSQVVFDHAEPLTQAEFEAAFDQVLQPFGLESRHIGPTHLRVLEVCVRR